MREQQKIKRSGSRLLVLLFMVLLGVGAWFFLGQGGESRAQDQNAVQEVTAASQEVPEREAARGIKVLVLNYHKIDSKHHSLSVRPADFE